MRHNVWASHTIHNKLTKAEIMPELVIALVIETGSSQCVSKQKKHEVLENHPYEVVVI